MRKSCYGKKEKIFKILVMHIWNALTCSLSPLSSGRDPLTPNPSPHWGEENLSLSPLSPLGRGAGGEG